MWGWGVCVGGGAALLWTQLRHQNNIPTIPRVLILFVEQS